jgi:F-type H+-transporting ATPase subunit a
LPQGVPVFLALFLFPVELIGQIAKPFSLAVRLFANMFAGHAIILTLISMIFIFKSYLVAPFPVLGNVAIMAFEVFVSFIQAFIFAFLSSNYIIGALSKEH